MSFLLHLLFGFLLNLLKLFPIEFPLGFWLGFRWVSAGFLVGFAEGISH